MKDNVGFYQVSDKVPAEIIKEFTMFCKRDDCRVSARKGMTTLAATADYYNKEGVLIVEDSNSYELNVCCGKCWKHAFIKVDYGKV